MTGQRDGVPCFNPTYAVSKTRANARSRATGVEGETSQHTINSVIAAMRRAAILQATLASPSIIWSLNDGTPVPNRIATIIIARPDVVGCGDSLFDHVVAQTYRHISQLRTEPQSAAHTPLTGHFTASNGDKG